MSRMELVEQMVECNTEDGGVAENCSHGGTSGIRKRRDGRTEIYIERW